MNLSSTPKTFARTPQTVSSSKTLQLTPIWEEVIKNKRLPPEVNQDLIFKEISVRLEDLEWPVRQHAFRVLYDIIPVLSKDVLDERILQNNISSKLVINLGHPAPGIRKVALETIQKYLKQTGQSEKMLENLLQYGIREGDLVNNDQAGILRENITLGTITSLVDILNPFIISDNGGYSVSQSFFAEIVEALASKVRNPHYREGCLEALWKLCEMVGKQKFFRALKDVPEKDLIMDLMDLYEIKREPSNNVQLIEEIAWSDETKSDNSFEENRKESFNLNLIEPNRKLERYQESSYIVSNDSSEDCTDGTDTETYTKEQVPNDLENDHDFCQINKPEIDNYLSPSFVPIDTLNEKDWPKKIDDKFLRPSSPRIVLEAEIPIAKDKALSMKVMEEDEMDEDTSSNANSESSLVEKHCTNEKDDLIVKTHSNNQEIKEDDKMRTPRRVRFGGEVIKLRTPDSDTTDITIETQEPENKKKIREIVKTREVQPKMEVNEEKPNILETKVLQTSQIPLPVTPATTSPRDNNSSRRREVTSAKKIATREANVLENNSNLFSNMETNDSAPSSSGSETEFKDEWEKNPETSFWQWTDLRLIEENVVNDLKNKDDWKIQNQAVEELKLTLRNPKVIEKIEKAKNQNYLNSLFKCLLYELPESSNHQATVLSLSVVSQLIKALAKDTIVVHVEDVVHGLCRYFGGCRNVNIKIESVQSLKTLFDVLEPSSVINILIGDKCLFSSGSKLRENSLLAIIYATMTFPSDYFEAEKILEKIIDSAADVRRRVRQAALEAIAVVSQFCTSKSLTDNISRIAERLSTPQARTDLIAAIQARLSRRLLPSISNEGLVLYALQIPASRRFGNLGSPMGADVDWILSGTGSVSTGSAKSRTQLNAAQRLDAKLTAPLSPRKWKITSSDEMLPEKLNNKIIASENPWTIQKNKNETSETKVEEIKINFFADRPPVENFFKQNNFRKEAEDVKKEFENDKKEFDEKKQNIRPEDITWALVPLSTLEESHLGKDRNNGLWGDSVDEGTPRPLSTIRPLYLKLQPSHEQLILSRSSDDVRRFSCPQESKKASDLFDREDVTEIRLLTPTVLRDRNSDVFYAQNEKFGRNESRSSNEYSTRIPVLYKNQKTGRRAPRSTSHESDRKISKVSDFSNDLKPLGLNQNENGFTGSAILLPTISTSQVDANYNKKKFGLQNKFMDVEEIKLQDTTSQLSGLIPNSKSINKSSSRDLSPTKNHSLEKNPCSNDLAEKFPGSEDSVEGKIQNKFINLGYNKSHESLPVAVSSAPPIISTELRRQTPSTSSSNSTDFGTLNRSDLRIRRIANESDFNHRLPCENYNTCNSKPKGKKASLSKSANKVGISCNHFSENLKPFSHPKEGLDTCFNQLESQQWEVNMLGLTSLSRLLKHHPAVVLSHLHPIIVALGQQIRNLRSQVARAACQASAEIFVSLKRNVEPDLDELSGPLFHRSADTNRFIRADCNDALDKMVDNVGHARAVSVIISKGTTHQNATVRAVAARLLLRLSERIGPEKLLSLPKDTRDKMLLAGANLLTEGKLETRAFAKQIFRIWSSQPSFTNLMIEAIPPNVMRNISKTLISLKS